MAYDFDAVIDRSNTNATKLQKYAGTDILPFWIADMDFAVPEFILEPLRARLDHPIIGYTKKPDSLTEAFQGWLMHHYGWQVPAEWVVWLPGVVPGLNMAVHTLATDEQLLVPTPIYYPFLDLQENTQRGQIPVPLQLVDGQWVMNIEHMTRALTDKTRMVCIANPQNPTGRCYSLAELQALAEFLERHDLLLVSDEIHCPPAHCPCSTGNRAPNHFPVRRHQNLQHPGPWLRGGHCAGSGLTPALFGHPWGSGTWPGPAELHCFGGGF
jgi:cystathionine beta-lyase